MRKLVAGTDDDGRSCLVESIDLGDGREVSPGLSMSVVFDDTGTATIAAGSRWTVVDWAPGSGFPLHDTATIDLVYVARGGGDLELEDGPHPIAEGDVVVLNGEMHGWRFGPDGCRMSIVQVPLATAD
jgi:quercetin dioxygenase-like cupin family protein